MRKYLKALFRWDGVDDLAMFTLTGFFVILAALLSPLWIPLYIVGRTAMYLFEKEYK